MWLRRINPWVFFIESAFSSPWFFFLDLCSPERFSDLVLLLLLLIFGFLILLLLSILGFSSSSPSSLVIFFGTRVSCGKNLSISAIKTRVFETRFFHRTRASDARDVIFLISSQFLQTNYILRQTPVILQIASVCKREIYSQFRIPYFEWSQVHIWFHFLESKSVWFARPRTDYLCFQFFFFFFNQRTVHGTWIVQSTYKQYFQAWTVIFYCF